MIFLTLAFLLASAEAKSIENHKDIDDMYGTEMLRTLKAAHKSLNRMEVLNRDDVDDGHRVTVTAKFWFVSDYEGGEAAAKATAEKYVEATNEALKNSEVPIDYMLWGDVQQLPSEATNDALYEYPWGGIHRNFLNALGEDSDSRYLLKQSADHIVLMFNHLNGLGGQCSGFGPWEEGITQMYSTIIVMGSEVTFAHEAGHCMGAMHNREATTSPSDEEYDYGYCLPDTPYATVMSYTYTCPEPARERILYYSNPEVEYEGVPTGTDKDNNARTMTEGRDNTASDGNNCMDGKGNTDNQCVFGEVPEAFSDWSECCCEDCWWTQDDEGEWVSLLGKKTRTKTRECTNLLGEPVYYKYCLAETGGAAEEIPEDYETKEIADCECSAPTEEPTDAPTEAPTEEPTEAPTEAATEAATDAPVEDCPAGCSCQTSTEKLDFLSVAGNPGDKFEYEFRTLTQIGGEKTYKNTAFYLRGAEDNSRREFIYTRGSKSGTVTLEEDHTGLYVYVYPYSGKGCEERDACQWYNGAWDFKACKV